MSDLLELAERCETALPATADIEHGRLINLAFDLLFPKPEADYQPRRDPSFSPEWEAWAKRHAKVRNFVQFGALESAAMLLVPEGWRRSLCDDPDDTGGVIAELWTRAGHAYANAYTASLALTAACLRARAASTPSLNAEIAGMGDRLSRENSDA